MKKQLNNNDNNNNEDNNTTTTTTTCELCPGKNSHLDGFLPVWEALVIFLFCLLCLLLLQIHNLPLGQKSIHPTEPCFFVEFVTNTCGILLLRRVCNKYVQNSLALPSSFAVVLHSLSQVFWLLLQISAQRLRTIGVRPKDKSASRTKVLLHSQKCNSIMQFILVQSFWRDWDLLDYSVDCNCSPIWRLEQWRKWWLGAFLSQVRQTSSFSSSSSEVLTDDCWYATTTTTQRTKVIPSKYQVPSPPLHKVKPSQQCLDSGVKSANGMPNVIFTYISGNRVQMNTFDSGGN